MLKDSNGLMFLWVDVGRLESSEFGQWRWRMASRVPHAEIANVATVDLGQSQDAVLSTARTRSSEED